MAQGVLSLPVGYVNHIGVYVAGMAGAPSWPNIATGIGPAQQLLYSGLRRWCGLPIIEPVRSPGRLAQRLERLVHTEEVGGSNPPSPTIGGL